MPPHSHPQAFPAIVLAGEEPTLLPLLQRVLAEDTKRISVVSVSDSKDVLFQMATRPVPLVITRDTLRDMHGISLTQHVRAACRTTHVALISHTASPQVAAAARIAGAAFYLSLPLNEADVSRMIRLTLY